MPFKPIKYQEGSTWGYRVSFTDPSGRLHRVRFSAARHPDPLRAAKDYIDSHVGTIERPVTGNLQEEIRQYLRWAEVTGKKRPKTVLCDLNRLMIFCEWASQHYVPSARQITPAVIRAFQTYFMDRSPLYRDGRSRPGNVPHRTWEKYRLILSAFLRWCIDRGLASENAAAKQEFRLNPRLTRPTVPRVLVRSELSTLLPLIRDTQPQATAGLFLTMLYAGLRLGEARQLLWTDVDLDARTLRVQHQTKSGHARTVPVAAQLHPVLADMPQAYLHVFGVPPKGQPMTGSAYYDILARATTALGIEGVSPKTFRHTFAATLAQNGIHIGTIKELLGHSSITVTMIYLHWQPAHLQAAVDTLHFDGFKEQRQNDDV